MKSYQVAICVLLTLCCDSVVHAAASPAHSRNSRLPDWSGLWESNIDFEHKSSLAPPYTEEWKAKADLARQGQSARWYCAEGMPTMMQVPDTINMFDILVTPKLTVMVFQNHEVRHIYTDGRSHPPKADLWPTPDGDSVGHWEGDTLVVDTISTRPQLMSLEMVEFSAGNSAPVSIKSTPTSDELRILERIRLLRSGILEDQMTIEDPIAFSHSWKQTYTFKRITDLNRMIYEDCTENERDLIDKDGKAIMLEQAPMPRSH